MADFRRWILALAVLSLFVGFASAQPAFVCTSNAGSTPTIRSEGFTELVGDIVITCSGGSGIAAGTSIPTANITVFFGTPVTSRIGFQSVSNASEALLLIDEPGSSLSPGAVAPFAFGQQQGQTLCPTPSTGCTDFSAVAPATNPSGTANSNAGSNVLATGSYNVFEGLVSGNSVTFEGVPILAPGTTGNRVFRMTNIRINAVGLNASGTAPAPVNAFISVSGSTALPLTNSQLVVGYATTSLTTALRNGSNSSNLGSSGATFNQCQSYTSKDSNGVVYGSFASILQYQSNFGTAFKERTSTGVAYVAGPPSTPQQNIPGNIYNNSESGFIYPTLINTSGYTAGLADFGTRFKAVFSNVPSGATILVSTVNIASSTTGAAGSGSASYAVLVLSETSPENGTAAPLITATTSGPGIPLAAITPVNGTATAVWEVISSNTTLVNQTFNFAVYLSYSSNTSNNTPATGPMTVNMSYAPNPTQGAFTAAAAGAASSNLPIPRFADTSSAKTFANVALCQTALLFPYVTTVTGFETGLGISNTTTDPFGTTAQSGTCTLNWYGNASGTPNPAAFTTPSVASGTTWTGISSTYAGANFTGYMIAVCNFQYAHGYAAITDVGVRNILASYLPLVMNDSNSGGLGGLIRVTGAGETLVH